MNCKFNKNIINQNGKIRFFTPHRAETEELVCHSGINTIISQKKSTHQGDVKQLFQIQAVYDKPG